MDINWIWQGVLTNWLYALLVLASGGTATWLKVKSSRWSQPLLYGLCGSTLAAMMLYAINAQHVLATEQAARTTLDNVQERVRTWLDNFSLQVQRKSPPDAIFQYVVTLRNGDVLNITQYQQKDHYLVLQGALQPTEAERTMLGKLTKAQQDALIGNLSVELARARVTYSNLAMPFQSIILERRIPVASGLTEDLLLNSVDDMDSAIVLVKGTIITTLQRLGVNRK